MMPETSGEAISEIGCDGIVAKPRSNVHWVKSNALMALTIGLFGLLAVSGRAKGQTAPSLGAAQDFAIISSQGVTNSGDTVITGDIALDPLTSITGFPPGVEVGTVHYDDAMAAQALADAHGDYNALAGEPFLPANNKTGLNLGGMALSPGVYHFNTSAGLTGALTLNTGANANAVFVFQIGSTLTTAVGSRVIVTGAGAKTDPDVFWQVGSSATLNSRTVFDGSIFALASVSLGTGATIVNGRVVALTGAVTLLGNTITIPLAAGLGGGGTLTIPIGPGGTVSSALGELSPQKYQLYGDLSISNATATVEEIDERLNNLGDGSESVDTTGLGGGTDADTSSPDKRWGFFASGNGIFFRGNGHNTDFQGGSSDTAGTVAGLDAKIGDHAVMGVLFAYDNANVTLGGDGSDATVQSYTGGLYGAWHQDSFYVNGLADYTRNDYSSDRNIVSPGFLTTAAGNTSGNQYTGDLDGGYDWHLTDRVNIGPITGLQYDHMGVDEFNESGAEPFNLAIGNQSMNSLQSRVGFKVDYHLFTAGKTSFAAQFHAVWQHEYLDNSRGINAQFIGSGIPAFSVRTSAPLSDSAVVGAGLNVTVYGRLTLFADYELQLWQASYFEQSVNGGARISF
jgi:outer membrane autotransporter protein